MDPSGTDSKSSGLTAMIFRASASRTIGRCHAPSSARKAASVSGCRPSPQPHPTAVYLSRFEGNAEKYAPGSLSTIAEGGGYVDCHPFGLRQMHRHQAAAGAQRPHGGQHSRPGHPREPHTKSACPKSPLCASSRLGLSIRDTSSISVLILCNCVIFINFYLLLI